MQVQVCKCCDVLSRFGASIVVHSGAVATQALRWETAPLVEYAGSSAWNLAPNLQMHLLVRCEMNALGYRLACQGCFVTQRFGI